MAGLRTIKTVFTGDAKGLNQAAKDGEKALTGWQKGVQRAGDAAAKSAAAAGAAVGLALFAGLAGTLQKSTTDALLAAQLGASGPRAAELGAAAGRLYARGVVGSVEDATAAIRAALQNALVPPDAAGAELDKVAAKVANLARVMEEDANRVSAAVRTLLVTGLAKSADEAFDILQRGVELGVNKNQDLLDTLTEYPTLFRALGLDAKKALGLLSQGLNAGARDSDKVADALKEFQIRATDGSKLSAQGFKALGLSAKKLTADIAAGGPRAAAGLDTVLDRLRGIEDPVKRGQAAVALFGTQAEDLAGALFALDPSKAVAGLGELEGAADRAGQTMEQSTGAKVEALGRTLKGKLVSALATAATWVEKNQQTAKTLAIVLGATTAVVVGVGVAMKAYAAIQAVIKAATVAWTGVQWALNVAMTANPVGVVVVAIAALVAAIVLIATKTTWFQDLWRVVWGGIKTAAAATGRWFKDTLWGKWIKPVWDGIASAALWVWNKAIKPAFLGWQLIFKAAAAVVAWAWNSVIKPAFNAVASGIASVINFVKSLAALWLWLWGIILSPILKALGAAVSFLWNSVIKPAWAGIQAGIAALGAAFQWLYQNVILPVWAGLKTAIAAIGAAFSWLWRNGVKPAIDAVGAAFSWLWTRASSIFSQVMAIVSKVRDTFKIVFSAIAGFISSAFNGAVSTVKGVINSLIDLINKAVRNINSKVIGNLNKIPGVSFGNIPELPRLARGGSARAGRDYLVGEKGPEVLRMGRNRSGSVVPNHVAFGGGDGGPDIIELKLDLGHGIEQVVQINLREYDRGKRRKALAGSGASR